MTISNSGFPSSEESDVSVVPYDPNRVRMYNEEVPHVEAAFVGRCAAIEHIGSTAVPELLAKPVVDILVASSDGARPSANELEALTARNYVFLGEDGRRPGRWFWRKRGRASFNLSLVRFDSDLWRDNLLSRDYLRTHREEVQRYAAIKHEAVRVSPYSLLGYQEYKCAFMQELRERANLWQRSVL